MLILVLIIIVLFFVFSDKMHCKGGYCGWGKSDSATDTLRERYAKGEISKEEFQEKTQTLKNS